MTPRRNSSQHGWFSPLQRWHENALWPLLRALPWLFNEEQRCSTRVTQSDIASGHFRACHIMEHNITWRNLIQQVRCLLPIRRKYLLFLLQQRGHVTMYNRMSVLALDPRNTSGNDFLPNYSGFCSALSYLECMSLTRYSCDYWKWVEGSLP